MTSQSGQKEIYRELMRKTEEIYDLRAASSLLEWDQEIYFPAGAGSGRAAQQAALSGVIHEKKSSSEYERLLNQALDCDWPTDSLERRMLLKLKRSFDKSRRVPLDLVRRMAEASALTQSKWFQAKQNADFSIVAENLHDLVELYKEYADIFSEFSCRYDVLLDEYEEGMTTSGYDRLFEPLERKQPELVRKIVERGVADSGFLYRKPFDPEKQMIFCREIISAMGYDWKLGRLDFTEHPFTTNIGLADVRITTKVVESAPLSCLFSCIHECGHALYEQNINRDFDRTPFADGASLGFHESQSRLWENLVGRSREFWIAFYPRFRELFPEQLADVSEDQFFRAVNQVMPNLIRTESDEATYNLHILLRYDIEKALFSDRVSVKELPDLWNAGMKKYLGIEPENDSNGGVLQDIHWYGGLFGYFPTYALGNLIGIRIYEKMNLEHPEFRREVAAGNLIPLKEYLAGLLYCHGAEYSPGETWKLLMPGEELSAEPYLRYLERKFLSL